MHIEHSLPLQLQPAHRSYVTLLVLSLLLSGGIAQQTLFAQTALLHRFDVSEKSASVKRLPSALSEISGLALTSDGKLYAHNDEAGRIYVLEPWSGKQIRSFDLGRGLAREDFEGIAVAGEQIWLVNSAGTLFAFSDPGTTGNAKYTVYKTALSRRNDVEGLCYDPVRNELLLACKEYAGTRTVGDRAVWAFSLTDKRLKSAPRFVLSRSQLGRITGKNDNGFSGIERNPQSGTFFLLSSKGQYLVELSAEGAILGHARLAKKAHPQPEGITFLRGGELVIADEGKKNGTLTLYPMSKR
ncbi:MAG: SdiA-regulated domain-containing protein [Bacteroidia bacterium]|nr:SdiA-regulated domain-containing protein [Bacteroidia bacterium]